jgi:molybdopterin-guanine dinucleotide biosynthesis protein MobB
MIDFPIPLMGFSAYSGTGKTTLLRKLLPLFKADGLRVAVVKHAHHSFDIDHPGKDSYELRKAGADQILVASRNRIAFIKESPARRDEPVLEEALALLTPNELDLVLVEGFKHAAIHKIELHRPSLGNPLLYPHDNLIMAIATDEPIRKKLAIPQLNLNDPDHIVAFISNTFVHPLAMESYF